MKDMKEIIEKMFGTGFADFMRQANAAYKKEFPSIEVSEQEMRRVAFDEGIASFNRWLQVFQKKHEKVIIDALPYGAGAMYEGLSFCCDANVNAKKAGEITLLPVIKLSMENIEKVIKVVEELSLDEKVSSIVALTDGKHCFNDDGEFTGKDYDKPMIGIGWIKA